MYSYIHLDSTTLLREGLRLSNLKRVNEDNTLPNHEIQIRLCPDIVDIYTMGIIINFSVWIGINLISLTLNLVVCDENQKELHNQLIKNNVEVIPMRLRQSRTFSGFIITLDTWRK